MRLIFHIPLKIDRNDPSASQIRPQKLMAAFAELGWEMDVVEGRAHDRKRQIAEIKRKIRQGVRYDFVYSESSTMPTLLTEPHHLPTYPCLDFGFLAFCKRHSIPIGLFYRDIYWQYANKNVDFKQWVARFFYRYDLRQYRRLLDVLFLPTLRMYEYVPCRFGCDVRELPSGCEIVPTDVAPDADGLRVLYVGGIGGDYNILPLVKAASGMNGVSLTVCCRTYDWDVVKDDYMPYVGGNVKVVHLKGKDVEELYRHTDLFAMPHCTEYVRFAAPYKLFEAVGHHTPLLAATDTWSGDFVERNNIGITSLNEVDALRGTLLSLKEHPERIAAFRQNMSAVAENNTWPARCRQIASALLGKEV
jgi:glycosyltransferase involved in cell wall biosynthesis